MSPLAQFHSQLCLLLVLPSSYVVCVFVIYQSSREKAGNLSMKEVRDGSGLNIAAKLI